MEDNNKIVNNQTNNNIHENEEKVNTEVENNNIEKEKNEEIEEKSKDKDTDIDRLMALYKEDLKLNENKIKINTRSIIIPIIKLLIVFIIATVMINYLTNIMNKKLIEKDLTGLWGDEYGNYYVINNNEFSMNVGNPDLSFYEGEIETVIKTDTGYKIYVDGKKYKVNTNKKIYEKDMELILQIKNYTNELKTPMTANIGVEDYRIIRLEDTIKE